MEDLTLLLRLARALGEQAAAAPASTPARADALAAHPYQIGEAVFVRTVTYHATGRLVGVYANEIVLADAAWIADSGRWSNALATGTLSEVEPYPDGMTIIISRGAIVDVCPWRHPLPRTTK